MSLAEVDYGHGGARVWANTDPAIKLFGRDIPVASTSIYEPSEEISNVLNGRPCFQQDFQLDVPHSKDHLEHMESFTNELGSSSGSNDGCEEVGPIPSERAVGGLESLIRAPPCTETNMAKGEDAQDHAAHEKMPKKPDKPLPCPRCESLDTKFCYFNNYNVNQPRHFCRKCQRYWTAGGTLRNVPIGAGRRKNKHSASHQKHVVVPDMMSVRSDRGDMAYQRCSSAISTPRGISSNQLKLEHSQQTRFCVLPSEAHTVSALECPSTKSTMLSFGQESPLCRSMDATTLSMHRCAASQNHGNCNGQTSAPADVKVAVQSSINNSTSKGRDAPTVESVKMLSADHPTSGSSATTQLVAAGMVSLQDEPIVNAGGDAHVMQTKTTGFSNYGGPWQLGSNIAWNNPFSTGAASALDSKSGSNVALPLPPPNFLAGNRAAGALWAGLPWPLMNPVMWGPPPLEWAGSWTRPWGPPALAPAPARAPSAAVMPMSGLATTVQKHQLESSQSEGCLWVPKTLRIDDPVDAARSSIWATLGLGNGPASSPAPSAAVMPMSGLATTVQKHQLESSQSEGCLWVPKTLRIDDPVDAARSSIWTTLGLGDGPASSPVNGATKAFQIKSETKDTDEATTPKWHTNPAAFSRSVAFNENS